MGKYKTHEEFINEIKEKYGDEYEVLGEYTGAKNKILVRHNNDSCNNFKFDILPTRLISTTRIKIKCPCCSGSNKKVGNHFTFIEKVKEAVGDEYEVLGEYVDTKTKIQMKHVKCGTTWMVTPNSFIRLNKPSRCPNCARGGSKKSTNYFIEKVKEAVGDEYEVLGEYEGYDKKILMRHKNCNCNLEITPSSFLGNKSRCNNPKCKMERKLILLEKERKVNSDKFIKRFREEVDTIQRYEIISEYINAKEKLDIKDNLCGCTFQSSPNNLLQGKGCPICSAKRSSFIRNKDKLKGNSEYFNYIIKSFSHIGDDDNYYFFSINTFTSEIKILTLDSIELEYLTKQKRKELN